LLGEIRQGFRRDLGRDSRSSASIFRNALICVLTMRSSSLSVSALKVITCEMRLYNSGRREAFTTSWMISLRFSGSSVVPIASRTPNTLISDQFNNQVIEVNHDGKIVFQQGQIAVTGDGFDMLNGPYDAKVNGDYTRLTPPFFF
jgi:hypothetical protein